MLSIDKAEAEGTPAETQTVLGWIVDTRSLQIRLPPDKLTEWTTEINSVLADAAEGRRVQHKTLDSLLGRLQHSAIVLIERAHFLNRVRSAQQLAAKIKRGSVRIVAAVCRDLDLWKSFLDKAAEWIDINRLVTQSPNWIIRTDACEHGLGGYSLTRGRVWRWYIPLEYQNSKSTN